MIFKFLEKPIVITAFASETHQRSCEEFPIVPASKFVPGWWKNTPKSQFDFSKFKQNHTVKSCVGIIGTFQNGYTIPLWSDLAIQTNKVESRWKFADKKSLAEYHPNSEIPNFYENYFKLKLISPWKLMSSRDIKYCYVQPFYTFANPHPFIVPFAVNSSIKKLSDTNIFLFLEKKPLDLLVKAGTPLLQIIPLTEMPVIFKTEIIPVNDFAKLESINEKIFFSSTGLKTLNDRTK